MAEHFLHHPKIRPSLEQMSSERVPEGVGRHRLGDPGPKHRGADELPETGSGERFAPAVAENQAVADIAAILLVDLNRLGRHTPQRHQTLLSSLAQHPNEAGPELDISVAEID